MDKSLFKKGILDVVRGLIFSLLYSMVLVLLVSVVVKYTSLDDKVATILNQVIKVLALSLGILTGFKSGKWGLVLGLVTGLLFTLSSFGIFSLISGKLDFGQITVFDFLLGAAVGLAAGVIAVNVRALRASRPHKERAPRQTKLRKAKA